MHMIAADVWTQAKTAHEDIPKIIFPTWGNAGCMSAIKIEDAEAAIAKAIMSERERAAKVAHGWMHDNGLGGNAADVAIEIWKGEEPT